MTVSIHVLIIEDELPNSDHLIRLLNGNEETFKISGPLQSVTESLDWLSRNSADLILMDIQLADGICFEIFEEIKLQTPVIFTTAYNQYALDAFKVNSLHYLIKPIQQQDLDAAITKYLDLDRSTVPPGNEVLTDILKSLRGYRTRFLVKLGNTYQVIPTDEILYFSKDEYTFIHAQNKKYPINPSLDELGEELDPILFFRINRQTLVNIKAVEQLTINGATWYAHIKGGDSIRVSSRKMMAFKEWLDQ